VLKLVARRIVSVIPIMLGVSLFAFLLIELMPGDPAAIMAGPEATPEAVARLREGLHLDEPIVERYFGYVGRAAQGDLGVSPVSGIPVRDRIVTALPVTLSLAGVALVMTVLGGVTAGTFAALRRGKIDDKIVIGGTSVLQAVPTFVAGLALVIPLAVDRPWLPAIGYVPIAESPFQWLRHLILPGFTMALLPAAQLARQTRGALVDTLEQDYIRALRAKGLRERRVIAVHAAKNSAPPVVTVLGLQVAGILGGSVTVELIFGLPGVGSLALSGVVTRDVVLMQGIILMSTVAVLAANLLVNISYAYFDPKVRQ
jgi:peptide/nickel transport system permease protein